MKVEEIEQHAPEPTENLYNLNTPGKLASNVFGHNLFRRIVAVSQNPEVWRTVEVSAPTPTGIKPKIKRRKLFGNDIKVTQDMDTNSKQLFFIVNQRDVYTLRESINATFGKVIPNELRRIIGQLKAIHLDTVIGNMPETFQRPEVNEEGQKAIEWLRPKVASFVLQNDPPKNWFTDTGNEPKRAADVNFIALDAPEIYLKKQYFMPSPVPETDTNVSMDIEPTVRTVTQSNVRVMKRRVVAKPFRLSSGSVRRLARRGGVKRLASSVRDVVSNILKQFVKTVVARAAQYTEYANRKTVTLNDVLYSLKHAGETLYM
jgi:histone H4